jgi:hypothetical protein
MAILVQTIDDGSSSPIDGLSSEGMKPANHSQGRIEFRNLCFSYPSRTDCEVVAYQMNACMT